jgi:RimJ/RimL family protein N-acetyltransferase
MTYLTAPERYCSPLLIVRSWRPEDGPLFLEAVNGSYEHLRRYMPWAKPQFTLEECERFVRRSRGEYLMATNFNLALLDPDERMLIGGAGFHLREGGVETAQAEAGMWIRASHAGRGFGTRALVAMLKWGFEAWPWVRISWRCAADNIGSQRVAEKAGMFREGVLHANRVGADGTREDTFCYVALRDRWTLPA